MARVKKFDILIVPIEVEYKKPILRRLFGALAWLMVARVKKFSLTMNGQSVLSFYRLIVPRFLKGGVSGEK